MKKEYPLIVIFYMFRETFANISLIEQISKSVNTLIESKNANMMAFFLATDTEERVECINPILVSEVEMERINNLIQDISKQFDIGGNLKAKIK
jgi:hypothetical protein